MINLKKTILEALLAESLVTVLVSQKYGATVPDPEGGWEANTNNEAYLFAGGLRLVRRFCTFCVDTQHASCYFETKGFRSLANPY